MLTRMQDLSFELVHPRVDWHIGRAASDSDSEHEMVWVEHPLPTIVTFYSYRPLKSSWVLRRLSHRRGGPNIELQ